MRALAGITAGLAAAVLIVVLILATSLTRVAPTPPAARPAAAEAIRPGPSGPAVVPVDPTAQVLLAQLSLLATQLATDRAAVLPAAQPIATANTADPSVPAPIAQTYPGCLPDLQTVEQVAAKIGGTPANWTAPDWVSSTSQGAWTFRSRVRTTLHYPGAGFFDTPQGRYFQQDVVADEASYHCEPVPSA
jgi:hypothetical protein